MSKVQGSCALLLESNAGQKSLNWLHADCCCHHASWCCHHVQVLKSPGTGEAQLDKAVAEVASTLAHNTADLEAWAVKAVKWVVQGREELP
jgi:hypothetical protein